MKIIGQGNQSSQSGFSLVETSIAAGILSVALLPMVGLMGVITLNERSIRDKASSMVFVEAISQTVQRESQSTNQFIWHFSGQKNPATIDYPTASGADSVTYFIGDETGMIVRSVAEDEYREGVLSSVLSEAFIIKTTMRQLASGVAQKAGADLGIELEISVETPIDSPEKTRHKESFQTQLL